MGLGFIKDFGKGVVNAGKGAVGVAKNVGGKAVDTAKNAGGKAVDTAKHVGHDAVHLSKEALDWKAKQESNFAHGVLEWGKGTVDTVVGIAKHPVATTKALGKLAANPVLNPIGGTAIALAQGKNPAQAYKDGVGQLKDLGTGIVGGYKDVYKKYGAAGVAGNLAPDIAIAILTGGSGSAAEGAAVAGGKAVALDVAEDVAGAAARATTREIAEEAVGQTARQAAGSAAKDVAKDVGKELLPGPEDIADQARRQDDNHNYARAGSIFDFVG